MPDSLAVFTSRMKDLFLTRRFFQLFGVCTGLFVLGFPIGWIFPLAKLVLAGALTLFFFDTYLLFSKKTKIAGERKLPKLLSLGDPNQVQIILKNFSSLDLNLTIVDELPVQFQKRDFEIEKKIRAGETQLFSYELTPVERGEYNFGKIIIYASTSWSLVQRRFEINAGADVGVFPSIIQMKKFELKAFSKTSRQEGIKKIRRLGHSYEFEQIKNYVQGDDYRSVNWKATGRRNELMVNQYEDERSQQIYCVIDKSRVMKMPFNGMSLLDYAINTSLVISNIALQKYDRVGLLSFSDIIGTVIKADRKSGQLNKILNALYKEKEHPLEANYELLYYASRKLILHRSLIFLFTNFESTYALERVLPILRRINKFHLLIPVFFENTEIKDFATGEVHSLEGIYHQTVAQKFVSEKSQMVQQLQQYGIQSILTRPEDLSLNAVNKYLELKARGLI
ncbi:MAG TPA: DUF58 domain-containing protein [Saprospiraceae bacterium]|nr:DUF58 domain-containing protein [Saprospiraceae bacterium]